jgi:probable blue pigment (indigoidine) exporter
VRRLPGSGGASTGQERDVAGRPPTPFATAPALLVATSVVAWGCTPRVTAEAAPHAGALTLTSLRAAPTAVLLLALLPILRYRPPHGRRLWFGTAASGLMMVTVFLGGFTEAIIRAGPGEAIVLASTAPFFVVLLNRVVYGQRVSPQALTGLVLGFAGVVLIVSSQLGGSSGGASLAVGLVLALAAAAGWAIGTLIVKELVLADPGVDLVGVTAGQYLVGGVVLLAISLGAEGSGGADWGSGTLWLVVAFVSIVGSALATITFFEALRRLSAATVSAWLFLSPVVAVLLEIVLGNTPRAIVFGGMALTIAGVAIVNRAPAPLETEEQHRPEVAAEA